ncbi:MAG: lycopene cyclase [Chitinophagaceae bacterium]|nr:lycopene cyclase [Chitinophagaceae bacterium]
MIKQYDYIIIGAGCAGLSLLMRILDNNIDAKVLLLDKTAKNTNDRTWCFWEKQAGYFDAIVYRKWDELNFCDESCCTNLALDAYSYKMIRSIDFYTFCFNRIQQAPGIDFQIADIQFIEVTGKHCCIKTSTENIEAEAAFVFNSITEKAAPNNKSITLLQHFKGWLIRAEKIRDNLKPCLMDFRVDQSPGTAFVYVLPVDEHCALVEYTVFSSAILPGEQYDIALKNYIENVLEIKAYTIKHTEFGIIPMTNERFPFYKNGMYYIGSAGGQTKPSSGYTFSFIQKQSECIARQLSIQVPGLEKCNTNKARFLLYDSILLKILHDAIIAGSEIFKRLFHRLPAHIIFKFIDNETALSNEIKILNAMPSKFFLPVTITK